MKDIFDAEITLYGVGISYMESMALFRTFKRVLNESGAVLYEFPVNGINPLTMTSNVDLTSNKNLCLIYYLTDNEWKRGYIAFKKNFALTYPKKYILKLSLGEIFDMYTSFDIDYGDGGYDEGDDGEDDEGGDGAEKWRGW